MPELCGHPIRLSALPSLTAWRGQLLSAHTGRGVPVHAASFIRRREIVLETGLLSTPATFRLILVHEVFHFVWARLANSLRSEFVAMLAEERRLHARGELGESADVRKSFAVACSARDRRWRDYACESFCDTAAWLYSGVFRHESFTLARRWRDYRRSWFAQVFSVPRKC